VTGLIGRVEERAAIQQEINTWLRKRGDGRHSTPLITENPCLTISVKTVDVTIENRTESSVDASLERHHKPNLIGIRQESSSLESCYTAICRVLCTQARICVIHW
jgi:hypothetical protein